MSVDPHIVKFAIENHATNEIVAETDSKIKRLAELEKKYPLYHGKNLFAKKLRCNGKVKKHALNGIVTVR